MDIICCLNWGAIPDWLIFISTIVTIFFLSKNLDALNQNLAFEKTKHDYQVMPFIRSQDSNFKNIGGNAYSVNVCQYDEKKIKTIKIDNEINSYAHNAPVVIHFSSNENEIEFWLSFKDVQGLDYKQRIYKNEENNNFCSDMPIKIKTK